MLLELLTSAAGGGVLGLAGSAFKAWGAYKNRQLEVAHEATMADKRLATMDKELELAKFKGELDLELQESDADAKGLQAAIEAEGKIENTSRWVNDVRGTVRPVLTYGLVAIAATIQTEAFIFMATTAVTFWFGDRPPKKR